MLQANTVVSPTLTLLSALLPAPWNPRTIREPRFKALCASLKADPDLLWRRPILAQADGTVYAGNMRLRAAQHLGWPEVPAVVEDVPDHLARERALRDNNAGGEWQEDDLAALVYDLGQQGADLETLGFERTELDAILASVGVGSSEDEVPEPPTEPITRPGDLWLLGPHRLLCGDATKHEDVQRLMQGARASLVFTDPPYGVDYDGGTVVRDKLAGDHDASLYGAFLPLLADATDPKAALYLWHGGLVAMPVLRALQESGYECRAQIIWNKNLAQFGALSAQYKQKHEPCWYAHRRGQVPYWYGPTNEVTVWDADRSAVNDLHPTQKPTALVERALRNSSKLGDLVLDSFLGSGTTLIAAQQLGRVCYGLEIEPRYCDVIVQRWEALTGDSARRELS